MGTQQMGSLTRRRAGTERPAGDDPKSRSALGRPPARFPVESRARIGR